MSDANRKSPHIILFIIEYEAVENGEKGNTTPRIFHNPVIKPVFRCQNSQNTINYDAIQVINPNS